MRGPTKEDMLKTSPPALRMGSKTTQAYLDMRSKILTGEYATDQVIIPKQIEEVYHINNTTTQVLLMRLANEGFVNVLPIKERSWPNNASLNEYRVADLTGIQKKLMKRQYALLPDSTKGEQAGTKEILLLKIQYADAEIAEILGMAEGEKVILYRERLRQTNEMVVAVSDIYIPFWFAEMLPELERSERDVYELMLHIGKNPAQCTETVDVVHARSVERVLFELSPDDSAPLLKLQRQTFDQEGHSLAIQFLTVKAESYRLQLLSDNYK